MQYRLFGQTGLKVSAFSFGSWITFSQLTKKQIAELVMQAFDAGINLFDTAEVYGEGDVENKLGDALLQLGLPREKFLLSTKVFWGGPSPTECGLTRKHIIEGCNNSLKRLKLDYIDFYSCHRPDYNTPVIETIIAMNTLIQQGKIIYWGTSEWPNELIIEAYQLALQHHLIPPSVEQFEYNLFCREKGEQHIVPIQQKTGMGFCTSMPFACGILAGRYNHDVPSDSRANTSHHCFKDMIESPEGQHKIAKAKQLAILAKEYDISLPQLSLYWCLTNKNIHSIILGTTKTQQLTENLKTLEFFDKTHFSDDIIYQINNILNHRPLILTEPSYAEVIAES